MCLQEYLCPVVVHVKVFSLIKRGQNWHLVLLQSLLVLEVQKVVKDLEESGWVCTVAETLDREVVELITLAVKKCVLLV